MLLDELIERMKNCEQTKGQTIYEHGMSVYLQYASWCQGEQEWKEPEWLNKIHASDLHESRLIARYLLFHDVGKPFCKIEIDGKVHFPNHAEVSANIYFEATKDELVSQLIRNDMVIHAESAEVIKQKLENKWTKKNSLTLLIASLAELHSNAELFGGTLTDSFKIKWKTIDRRGKQILKFYE